MLHHLVHLILDSLATWFLWESTRLVLRSYLPPLWYDISRVLHPVLVWFYAYLLIGDWRSAMVVAALVAILRAVMDRFDGNSVPMPVEFFRNRHGGLPPLP